MRNLIVALVLSLTLSLVLAQADPCVRHLNCYDCLYNNETCGWCGSTGKCLSGNPSTQLPLVDGSCFDLEDSSAPMRWEYTTSHVISATGDDGRITPTDVEIFLRPGVPVTFPVTVRVPFTPPIDFLLIQDVSFSMGDDIVMVSNLLPDIINALLAFTNGTACNPSPCLTVGLASFIEKPVMPFANSEAHVFRPVTLPPSLMGGNDGRDRMITSLNSLLNRLERNFEHPENSLEALMMAVQDTRIGWRQGTFKIPLILTDAAFHEAGDGQILGIFTPNNGDAVADGNPPGSGEDYPTRQQVRQAALQHDATPMFAAHFKIVSYYQQLVQQWGFGSAITVTGDSSNIVEAITNGTAEALSKAVLGRVSDDLQRVNRIDPNFDEENVSGTYTNVTRNTTLIFNVTMLAPIENEEDFGREGEAQLKYVGFGNAVNIKTITLIQCIGCTDLNQTWQIDLCNICGGDNTLCIGCDGIRDEINPKRNDPCGVCDGDGSSCADCFNVTNGNATFDVCGVCGGAGSLCLGCDGVPNSGAVLNDCGECNGRPDCSDYAATIITVAVLASIGIIVALLALLFLIGVGAMMARADVALVQEEATLQDNPLYQEAKNKFENPLYNADGAN